MRGWFALAVRVVELVLILLGSVMVFAAIGSGDLLGKYGAVVVDGKAVLLGNALALAVLLGRVIMRERSERRRRNALVRELKDRTADNITGAELLDIFRRYMDGGV